MNVFNFQPSSLQKGAGEYVSDFFSDIYVVLVHI